MMDLRGHKTGCQLKNNKQQIVDDERPFPPPLVCCQTEADSADRTQHEHKCYTPCDVFFRAVELFGQRRDGERDGEEIE